MAFGASEKLRLQANTGEVTSADGTEKSEEREVTNEESCIGFFQQLKVLRESR